LWLSRLVRKPDALGPSVDGSRPITDWGIGTLREPIVICDGNRQSPTPSSNVVTSPWEVPFRTQHPLGAVVNRPSVWSDR